MGIKRQNNQLRLAFGEEGRSEAPMASGEGSETLTAKRMIESPAKNHEQLMEEVCERENCLQAYKRVKSNKGSPGIDGMTVEQLPGHLKEHWPAIREQLLSGTYKPQPVRRVEIPKPDGGVRQLGIPTVLDRMVQQAVMQVLQSRWDAEFSEHSHGFRPGRSAHQAVRKAQQYVAGGRRWVVDLDLEKFLDRTSYCPLIHEVVANRWGRSSTTLILKPLRRPQVMSLAWSSPRFTRCNTVCRETPSFMVASSMGRYSGGACSTMRARSSSVMRICHGAPGVTCLPAMKPSASQRWMVEVFMPRIWAALRIETTSPCVDCAEGWKRGMPR